MAHEVSDWKNPNCSVSLKTSGLSKREGFSREINEKFGEGGGLNADYTTVEAVARAANILGGRGFLYGEQFVFKTSGMGEISFDFCDAHIRFDAIAVFRMAGVL